MNFNILLILAIILVITICIYLLYYMLFYNYLPKNIKIYSTDKYNPNNILRDRFSKKKIPKDIDCIIIGSGIGGLALGAMLSKIGHKILILEQHYIAGGCTHTFNERGYEFDTGIHYVGNVNKLNKVLTMISTKKINWYKLGSDDTELYNIYDKIIVNNDQYLCKAGYKNFLRDRILDFPNEKEAIEKYVKLVKHVAKLKLFIISKMLPNKVLSYIIRTFFCREYYYYATKTAYEVISKLTTNKRLITVLCGQAGNYALSPYKVSFYIHASMVNHYFEGGFYPINGCSEFAKGLISTINKSGGRVLVSKAVHKILVKNKRAIGIEMENGYKIYAKYVVSNCGIHKTQTLLNESIKQNTGWTNIKIKHSTPYYTLFVALEGNKSSSKLPSANIWYWKENMKRDPENYNISVDNLEDFLTPIFISFPSTKDPTWNNKYPNKSTANVIVKMPYEFFTKWQNQKSGKRDIDYQDFTKKINTILINKLLLFYPQLKDKINFVFSGSPLTNKHYLGYLHGECIGLENTPERYINTNLSAKTPIDNLYLTGQDICTPGFSGALSGAIITANVILGYGTLYDILVGRDFIKELENYEQSKRKYC